jgi:hypothetical protein
MKQILLLLSFFPAIYSVGQKPIKYTASSNGGLCSSTLLLYPNREYVFESGCEASSHVSFGTWAEKKDTIKLNPVNNKSYPIIKSIETNGKGAKYLSVMVLDNKGINVTNKLSIGLAIEGKGSYLFDPDSTQTKKTVFKRPNGRITSHTLKNIFGQDLNIPADSADNFIITLNFPSEWIWTKQSDWGGFGPFGLLKKKNKLYTFGPHIFQPLVFEVAEE